jgi:hypothetical protein
MMLGAALIGISPASAEGSGTSPTADPAGVEKEEALAPAPAPALMVGRSACSAGSLCVWSGENSGNPTGSFFQNSSPGADNDLSNNVYQIIEPGYATYLDNTISFASNDTGLLVAFYSGYNYSGFLGCLGDHELNLVNAGWDDSVSSIKVVSIDQC